MLSRVLPILFLVLAGIRPASGAERVALVIGCGKYRSAGTLETSARDAEDLARLLATPALGFDVVVAKTDATIEEFYAGLREFRAKAAGARVALFYFSGHGIEADGRNFLLPVDATLDSENQLETQAMDLRRVLEDVGATGATVKLVILDCCRDNPFAKTKGWLRTKGVDTHKEVLRRLGEAEIPQATLVCFAASAGRKAASVLRDGSANSPFTQFLLEELPRPGLSLRDVFENVRDNLSEATEGRQVASVRTDDALSPVFRKTILARGTMPPAPPSVRATPTPALPREESAEERLVRASKAAPFESTLGLEFVPAGSRGVLFARTKTRLKDFQAFVQDTGYDAVSDSGNGEPAFTLEADKDEGFAWKQAGGSWKDPRFPAGHRQSGEHPVVCVSYHDAEAFCAWLTKKDRADGRLPLGWAYRLPTEEEWSRAAGNTKYPWGDEFPPKPMDGNYAGEECRVDEESRSAKFLVIKGRRDAYARSSPVGAYPANAFGLYDLGGNAWEWCATLHDNHHGDKDLARGEDIVYYFRGSERYRGLRGGAWNLSSDHHLSSSFGLSVEPTRRVDTFGFRCVLSPGGAR